jgi:fucose permease
MKRFLITSHIVYALIGIAMTMLGPLLPILTQRWHLGDRQAGGLFLAQFFGGFTGAILSTRLAKSYSLHLITRAGLLLTALGCLGLATPWSIVAISGIALYGFGMGLCTPSITAAVSEAAPDRRASILNLLNFAWALGAIAAPILILAALQRTSFQVPGMLVAFAGVLTISAFVIPKVSVSSFSVQSGSAKLPAGMMKLIVACGAFIFIYVGIENGVAGWLPTLATRVHGFGLRRGALLQDTFWTTFLLGRFCAPVFLEWIGDRLLLTLSISVASAATVAMLLLGTPVGLFISVAGVGAGCAAIFPTAIAMLSQRLSVQSGSRLGFMFASAGLGAAALPFCIGSLSAASQNLRLGMSLLVVAEAGLFATHFLMSHYVAASDKSDVVTKAPMANRAAAG